MAISKIQSDSITDSAVTSDKISGGAIGVSDLSTQVQGALGTRNLIINGDFQVWQRGTSGSATDSYASADRMVMARGTLSQQTFTTGDEIAQTPYYANFAFTSQVYTYVGQKIEDVRQVAGKEITVSFWIKSSTLNTVYLRALSNYGSGGSSTVLDKSFENISISSSWQRITRTFTVTSLTGKTIGANNYYEVDVYSSVGTAATGDFDIFGLQVELNSTATPFEHRPYDMELARCQRYFQKFDGVNCIDGQFYSSSVARFHVQLSPSMRTAPTGVWDGTLTASVEEVGVAFRDPTGYSVNGGSTNSYTFNATGISGATASKQAMFRGNLIALSLSAEL